MLAVGCVGLSCYFVAFSSCKNLGILRISVKHLYNSFHALIYGVTAGVALPWIITYHAFQKRIGWLILE